MPTGCARPALAMSPGPIAKCLKNWRNSRPDARTSELVAAPPALGFQIGTVVGIVAGLERHPLDDADPRRLEALDLPRIVGQQPDLVLAEQAQHRCGDG